jgi:hypothetical protein
MSYVVDGDPSALTDGEGEVKDTNGDHHPRSKLIAKLKSKMSMVIPHPQFDGEGEVEMSTAIPRSKLMAKVKSKMSMVILLLQIDGEGEVEDADTDGNPFTPKMPSKAKSSSQ